MTEDKLIKNTDNIIEIEVIEIEGYKIGTYEVEYIERIKGLYGFIYVTTNLINGKMYVGQRKMRQDWKYYLGSGTLLRKAIKKYGRENFTRYIVDIAFDKQQLDELEKTYIKMFCSTTSRNWYNIAKGGNVFCQNEKPVVLYDISGNYIKKFCSITIASTITGDSRQVIRDNCNGKTLKTKSNNIWRWEGDAFDKFNINTPIIYSVSQHVVCYDTNGVLFKIYQSMRKAEKETGVAISTIKLICNGKQFSSHGYVFRYDGDCFEKYTQDMFEERKKEKLNNKSKKVKCYNIYGDLLEIYPSIREASRRTGAPYSGITNCCEGKIALSGGYVWRYIDDEFNKYDLKIKTQKIYCFNGIDLISTYKNLSDACSKTGHSAKTIKIACMNNILLDGYQWFFEISIPKELKGAI